MSLPVSSFGPVQSGSIASAIGWLSGTLLGTLATTLCVIAIAIVGFSMLTGRLPVRRGAKVVLGSFLLLGAPAIAMGLSGMWQSSAPPPPPPVAAVEDEPRGDLPPSDFSPYAGASLRQD